MMRQHAVTIQSFDHRVDPVITPVKSAQAPVRPGSPLANASRLVTR